MKSQLIYDIGMYDGGDTALYLSKGYTVVAVEANPELVVAAERRFAREIAAGRLTIINVAVAESWGSTTLWIAEEHPDWSTLDRKELVRRGVVPTRVEVECRPFGSILEEYGAPFYLKVDIEGADHHVIAALDPSDLPQYCSFELLHSSWLNAVVTAIDKGFTGFKLVAQNSFSELEFRPHEFGPTVRRLIGAKWKPLNALEYRREDFIRVLRHRMGRTGPRTEYAVGNSGPFGEETPGVWMDAEQALFTWLGFRLRHTRVPHGRPYDLAVWHDLHCRR